MDAPLVLHQAIAHRESAHDFTSRDLFERVLATEEDHVDTLKRQFDMIAQMGLENDIQVQSKPVYDEG